MIYFAHEINSALRERLEQELNEEELVFAPWPKNLEDITIVVGSGSTLTWSRLEALPRLKWVHSVSAGVDMMPLDKLREHNILLSNSRGIHGKPIAEQILGMLIAFSRGLHGYWRNQETRRWERQYPVDELTGKTLVILGAGSIGREVARKAQAFDMTVVGVKSNREPMANFDRMLSIAELDDVLPEADFVVVLVPLTSKTHHLINDYRLHRMKSSAVLINFARGVVVDQSALTRALQDHTIRGAGLDVFKEEPLPAEDPLWTMEQVIITPHTGGWTPYYDERLVEIFMANWRAFRNHQPLITAVDLVKGY